MTTTNEAMGEFCAGPGESKEDSLAINTLAMQRLRDALAAQHLTVASPLDKETLLHASLRYYATEELDESLRELNGADSLGALLAYLRDTFSSVELVMDDGVSQGYTTTFRGRARVGLGDHIYSYLCRCGFRASDGRVIECWFEIQPPPTLREVFQ